VLRTFSSGRNASVRFDCAGEVRAPALSDGCYGARNARQPGPRTTCVNELPRRTLVTAIHSQLRGSWSAEIESAIQASASKGG